MSQYFKIGKFVAVHGLNGELVLEHSLGKKTSLKGLACLYLEELKQSFLPYFIETTKIKSESEILIKLEGIHSREAAKRFSSKEVWMEAADFDKYAGKSAPISLLGFHIIHEEEDLGEILEVIEQPHQILCTILYKEKEVYIPLHEASLLKTDRKNRKVFVELPDGLLEIYE